MSGFESLVVATDFSPESEAAVRRAAAIANETGVPGVLAHVLPAMLPAEVQAAAVEQASHALAHAIDALDATSRGFSSRLLTGDTTAELSALASRSTLLVAGTREWDPVRHLALGRTSTALVRDAAAATLIVKRNSGNPYRRVLVAVDLSPASVPAIAAAAAIAPGAQFELLHAFEVEFEPTMRRVGIDDAVIDEYRGRARAKAISALDALASRAPIPREWIATRAARGDPRQAILERAAEGADLIAMGKRPMGAMERFFVGSVALHVLERAACDVLVAPQEAS